MDGSTRRVAWTYGLCSANGDTVTPPAPAGGAAGRADAMIGAVEAQKAEDGVLHVHMFVYIQSAGQQSSLQDLAEQFQSGMLTPEAFKAYISHVRCASYPDHERFLREREGVEQQWPAFADDLSLCRLPAAFRADLDAPAHVWRERFDLRLQHALSRMNHHIHPLVDGAAGERRPLSSCAPKGKPGTFKGGFPLEDLLTEVYTRIKLEEKLEGYRNK